MGDTLAEMLDERVDRFSEIAQEHLGSVFLALEPLRQLDLGELRSSDLIDAIKTALERMDEVSENEMLYRGTVMRQCVALVTPPF